MTPHQIDLVRDVLGSVDATDADLGGIVLDRFAAQRPDASGLDLDLCGTITGLVAGLDRVDLLLERIGGLADALRPLHPSAADLAALGTALDGALAHALAVDDYTPAHAEACHLAWLLFTELLHQRPASGRPARRP